jgi:hypothetical protein
VRSEYRSPEEPKSPRADAISDTYALGILAGASGLGIPVVMLPFVNAALAERIPSSTAWRGSGQKTRSGRVRRQGLEPRTRGLRVRCSAN